MRILITGATGGLGSAMVSRLAAGGHEVAACDHPKALERAGAVEGAACAVGFDVFDTDAIRAGVAEAASALGGLDGVVANAGITDTIHRSETFPLEGWRRDLDGNLTGALVLAQAAFEPLRDSEAGALVFIASMAGALGLPGQVAYSAAKAGIVGMTKTLAAEWGPHEIRANAILPGLIATPRVQEIYPAIGGALVEQSVMKRPGEPSHIAATVEFLLSPGAGYITGQALSVDGGMGLCLSGLMR